MLPAIAPNNLRQMSGNQADLSGIARAEQLCTCCCSDRVSTHIKYVYLDRLSTQISMTKIDMDHEKKSHKR